MPDPSEYEVARLDALDPGGLLEVQAGGETVLLLRDEDTVHAIGGLCPHAGARLAEGIRHGTRVVCPWHKAAFCARTGAVLDPPAVDDVPRYTVRIADGRVFVRIPAAQSPTVPPAPDTRHFVILGGGAAGAIAAQTLRQEGFGGRVTLIDAEGRVPYDRTVLSKYFLSGEQGAEKSPLQTQAFYRDQGIDRLCATVVRLDAVARRVTFADGTSLDFDAALLATGAAPARPDLPGAGLAHVFLLRNRADADALLAQAERSTRAVVLGASFIGMEVAASLRERGMEVKVVAREQAPFETQLGAQIGGAFVTLHEKRGVRFAWGQQVTALRGDAVVQEVVLASGDILPADLVVIGFGVSPVTQYAQGLTRHDDGGIIVDANLQAAAGIFAAGDIAHFPARGAGLPMRVEHWRVAEQHGRVAAMNMLGRAVPFDAVPVFWTIQYRKRLDYVGHAREWDEVTVHGDLQKPEFLAYYGKDGKVQAAVGMDRDRDMAALIELLSMRRDWTALDLGDAPAQLLANLS